MTSPISFVPLGGLGEIGMNCMTIESATETYLLDCGVCFDDRELGVDVVHADFSYLRQTPEKLKAVILTHGHEDHIGAVAYLLQEFQIPVYGPRYAISLVKERLSDTRRYPLENLPELHVIHPGKELNLGEFGFELFPVSHSIPDAHGLLIRTPQGIVVHSGDFKLDREGGESVVCNRLEEIGQSNDVRLLMSDSTNALVEGHTSSEDEVAEALLPLVEEAPGRVILSVFSSNVHRMRAAARIARQTGRKLCILGRSLDMHARLAQEMGHADLEGLLIQRFDAEDVPPKDLLVLATGTQGESNAALARLAYDTHPNLSLSAGDRVIHSARIIPGCEKAAYEVLDQLAKIGIEVIWKLTHRDIHTSGHAKRDELRALIRKVQPQTFVPVHGTYLHLQQHAELARRMDVPQVVLAQNGDVITLDETGLRLEKPVVSGRVHRTRGRVVAPQALKDRALLAELGVVFATAMVNAEGRPVGAIDVLTRGVVNEDESTELLDDACDLLWDTFEKVKWKHGAPSDDDLEDLARRTLRYFWSRQVGRKPLCYCVVMRVDT